MPGVTPELGVIVGEPTVEIRLATARQGEVVGSQPVEQGDGGTNVLADPDELVVGCLGAVVALPESSQQVPDRVTVQQLLLVGVSAIGDSVADPPFQPGHLLVARRQRPDRHQHAAQVLDRLAGRQRIQRLVREGLTRQLAQDRWRGAFVQPCGDGAGPIRGSERVVQRRQLWADFAGVVAEHVAQPLAHRATSASSIMDFPGFSASRVTAPEIRIRTSARSTQRHFEGAASDGADLTATGAGGPALFAGTAPRSTGGLRDQAGCGASADRAFQCFPGAACLAERPGWCSDTDRSATTARGAGLLVDGVGDKAGRTQRSAVFVAGSGFFDRPAACAGLSPGFGHAGPAKPLPVNRAVQVDDSLAVWAGRVRDRRGAGVAELVDQPQHRWDWGLGTGAGEQVGPFLQRPREWKAPPGAGHRGADGGGHDVCRHRAIDAGDHVHDDLHGIAAVAGKALGASGIPAAVSTMQRADVAAGRTGFPPRPACTAVPILAAPLQRAQMFATFRADRWRDRPCACRAQGQQQIGDHAGA